MSHAWHIAISHIALLDLKEEESTSMYIYTYVYTNAQNSVYTVHTYVYTEGISVLHWPHIATAWASLHCTTRQQKHSHFQYDHWITMLQMCTSYYVLYTVVSGFLVLFPHCTPQSLTWLIYWNCGAHVNSNCNSTWKPILPVVWSPSSCSAQCANGTINS